MQLCFVLIISVLFSLIHQASTSKVHVRHKSLINLYTMTKCHLQISAFYYNGYGCYCGYGGGGTPVDDIDRCCMEHDYCYSKATTIGGCSWAIQKYLTNYHYQCTDHEAYCLKEKNDCCQEWLCECDRAVVYCWAKYKRPAVKPKCKGRIKCNSSIAL
ncbi:hypothetical protein AB6A40_009650 [Gnathostoma spinigerum]|uniref:Phospholipase A2 n=1 Tax=Gnathostoma spinigerum TaxID=75299 RepID=A0ABD6ESW3_9BILA